MLKGAIHKYIAQANGWKYSEIQFVKVFIRFYILHDCIDQLWVNSDNPEKDW